MSAPALYGLIGHPLAHSLSPALHGAAFAWANLPGHYVALPTAPEALEGALAGVRAWRLPGLNVTVPHKQAVMPLLDEVTPLARRLGAVNTLFWREGRLVGDNTDYAGFYDTLPLGALRDAEVVVLGAGGAARAVVAALADAGACVHVVARRAEAARALREDLLGPGARGSAWPWEVTPALLALLASTRLLVNASSAGLDGAEFPLAAAAFAALPPTAELYDLVYSADGSTPFLLVGRSMGLRGQDGREMLMGQAAHAFERWTGRRPPLEVLRAALARKNAAEVPPGPADA